MKTIFILLNKRDVASMNVLFHRLNNTSLFDLRSGFRTDSRLLALATHFHIEWIELWYEKSILTLWGIELIASRLITNRHTHTYLHSINLYVNNVSQRSWRSKFSISVNRVAQSVPVSLTDTSFGVKFVISVWCVLRSYLYPYLILGFSCLTLAPRTLWLTDLSLIHI